MRKIMRLPDTYRFSGFRPLALGRALSGGDSRVYREVEVRRVQCRRCGAVKQERLPWLADNPFYTKRFAFYVGRRCRSSTIRDVARGTWVGTYRILFWALL